MGLSFGDIVSSATTFGSDILDTSSFSIAQAGAASLQGSNPTAEYAPNGFGDFSASNAPARLGTLSQQSQSAINTVFGVTYNSGSGSTTFSPTRDGNGNTLSHVYDYANYDRAFPNGNDTGTRGTDNTSGQSYAFVSSRNAPAFGQQAGIGNPVDATAAQEVGHNIVASHPQLKGKITTEQSEVIGEAVSLNRDANYATTAFTNALIGTSGLTGPGSRAINPNYSGISATTQRVLDGMAQKYGFNSGQSFMSGYVRYMAQQNQGQFSSRLITQQSLEQYVNSLGGNGANFTQDFQANMRSTFTQEAQTTISNALAQPNIP